MAKGKDGNSGGRRVDDYIADQGKMDSPWFSGSEDPAGRNLMHGAPSVKNMDGCKGGVRDGTSGANDYAGAGRVPGSN